MERLPNQNLDMPSRRLAALKFGAVILAGALALAVGAKAMVRHSFFVDDAFVYWRYAQNLRDGLGVSWNPDGVPIYGLVSPLWCFVLLPLTYLPLKSATALPLASWFTGLVALSALAMGVSRNATSAILKTTPLAVGLVFLPLLLNSHFIYHLTTGMDTMLSLLANVLLMLAVLEYVRAPAPGRAMIASFAAFIAVLVRPENVLCALTVPALAWLGSQGKSRGANLVALFLPNLALIAVDLVFCERYFGSALPNDVVGKSLGAFNGFMSDESSVQYAFKALLCFTPFLGLLFATLKYRLDMTIAALVIPASAVLVGLVLCRQHMGFEGRFYMPYAAYFVMAAMLCLDAGLKTNPRRAMGRGVVGVVLACLVFAVSVPLQHYADRVFLTWNAQRPVPQPLLETGASVRLPTTDWQATTLIVGQLVARLPPRAVVAAAEVGYLGIASPKREIIDLTGVNDKDIALNGFDTDRLLRRAPDFIWLPPLDYTGLRAAILSDQRFMADYRVIVGAFNDGVAVRRTSVFRASIDQELKSAWNSLYPHMNPEDYVAR